MPIDRDVYQQERNEIERQFAQHNLERDMAEAGRKAPPIMSKEEAARHRTGNWLLLLVLIGLVALVCYFLGIF